MFDIYSMKMSPVFVGMVSVLIFFQTKVSAQGNEQQSAPTAPELAGKWCYVNLNASTNDAPTNSCFTLNADGSFEATLDRSTLPGDNSFSGIQDSDYGRWWVKGNRIFYNSTVNGLGSFVFQKMKHPRLENTPVLVLNGIPFVTASSHDPW